MDWHTSLPRPAEVGHVLENAARSVRCDLPMANGDEVTDPAVRAPDGQLALTACLSSRILPIRITAMTHEHRHRRVAGNSLGLDIVPPQQMPPALSDDRVPTK